MDRWETKLVSRTQMKNAPYNARTITPQAMKKLKQNLESMGLMGGIIWNERTGNLVSGHQRLKLIDAAEGTDNYEVMVTVVDLDEIEEKAQSIFLNNTYAMGDFDDKKLEALLMEVNNTIQTGFSESEQIQLFGRPVGMRSVEEYEKAALQDIKDQLALDKMRERNNKAQTGDFYCVLVFRDVRERDGQVERIGLEPNKFYDGNEFLRLAKEKANG